MTRITKNVDLNDGKINRFNGWETAVASAFNVIINRLQALIDNSVNMSLSDIAAAI